MADNMDNIMHVQRDETGMVVDQPVKAKPSTNDPLAAVRAATGLNLTEEDIMPKATAKKAVDGIGMLTKEEAEQLRNSGEIQKVDMSTAAADSINKKVQQFKEADDKKMDALFSEALSGEEARTARISDALDDESTRAELYKGTEQETTKVKYTAEAAEAPAKETKISRVRVDDAQDVIDDLIPAYTMTPEEEEAEAARPDIEEKKEERPNASQPESEYAEYLQNLTKVTYEEDSDKRAVSVVREKTPITTDVPTKRGKGNNLMGDQAFLNNINKFKKDNFRTVRAPLINSGFTAEIVGTGAVDLNLLYSAVDENTLQVDYDIEKMRTVLRNVVGTNPKINPNELRSMIHFADFQMMAYAHIAATLKDVELVHTCDECGKDFHITANSQDLIINMEELKDRIQQLNSAENVSDISLLATDKQMKTASGFTIDIGHPSYEEYIRYMNELKNLSQNLAQTEAIRISRMVEILPFIRKITLPNGAITANLYQRYLAIGLLNEEDYDELVKVITELQKQIIVPRFGIKQVECPHCKKKNTNIAYSDLNDLLFFHITVTRLLNQTAQ